MRAFVLIAIAITAAVVLTIARSTPDPLRVELPQLSYVTTAHQHGVVGYRDPIGVVSPDGRRFAYTEGRFIRVVPIGGGAPVTLAPGGGQIRYLSWKGNDQIVAEDPTSAGRWWIYSPAGTDRRPLWTRETADPLRQVAWAADGSMAAALVTTSEGVELRRFAADGSMVDRIRVEGRASFPAFLPEGRVGCVVNARLTIPCGGELRRFDPDVDVYGPIAFAANRRTVYFASPNDSGMVELWSGDLDTGEARRFSAFVRDAYAPTVAANDTVVFKVQTYRTHLADVAFPPNDVKSASRGPGSGGATRQLTTFQSETPSYHPSRPLIAFTYGTWRRVVDDAKYPDIAQEIGTLDVNGPLPAAQPAGVVARSDSEDQAMTWSPNGKWIAFHTHKEMSDDIWLRPADGSQPDKRITFLGRGAEVGWPRWSPDGETVLLNGARKSDGASVLYTIGVDQETGATTPELREIKVEGVAGEMGHAEWMPGSASVIALVKEGPGKHAIVTVPVAGGAATIVHRFDSEHDFSGLGVSSNGRFVAFAAPAPDGFFQIFVKAVGLSTPAVQLTTDPSNKTQPTFSPDGTRVAFTVWSYTAAFWSFVDR